MIPRRPPHQPSLTARVPHGIRGTARPRPPTGGVIPDRAGPATREARVADLLAAGRLPVDVEGVASVPLTGDRAALERALAGIEGRPVRRNLRRERCCVGARIRACHPRDVTAARRRDPIVRVPVVVTHSSVDEGRRGRARRRCPDPKGGGQCDGNHSKEPKHLQSCMHDLSPLVEWTRTG